MYYICNMNINQKKGIMKNMEQICEILKDKDKLTEREVLNIIEKHYGFNYLFKRFLDEITSTADYYSKNYSKKELKEYVNSLQRLIDYEISKKGNKQWKQQI